MERIIEILSRVRENGCMLHLHVIGTSDDDRYIPSIKACVETNRSWISIRENLPRQDLAQLVTRHRYGIHAMDEEHFGIAVAEMVRAGCIVFAPNNGGPAQILGEEQRLLYGSVEDAAQKIQLTMDNPERQKDLRDYLAARSALFSAERFVSEFRKLVQGFESISNYL